MGKTRTGALSKEELHLDLGIYVRHRPLQATERTTHLDEQLCEGPNQRSDVTCFHFLKDPSAIP